MSPSTGIVPAKARNIFFKKWSMFVKKYFGSSPINSGAVFLCFFLTVAFLLFLARALRSYYAYVSFLENVIKIVIKYFNITNSAFPLEHQDTSAAKDEFLQ